MTKVEAIQKVMEDNNGVASWDIVYQNIEKYYPTAKSSDEVAPSVLSASV